MAFTLHLRTETKPFERRSALTPSVAKQLIEKGWKVQVERDDDKKVEDGKRIFRDEEYESIGCQLVEPLSYRTISPEIPVIGLKELLPYPPPDSPEYPLPHTHITFAHCFKQQSGWKDILNRWSTGGGMLYDIEFLQDESGRRVAAFGHWAGFVGAGEGVRGLAEKLKGSTLPSLVAHPEESALVSLVSQSREESQKILGRNPRALVMGALGRCGRGAVDCLLKGGFRDEDILKWDLAETARGGPFEEILDVDIFINCIYLSTPIPPFITKSFISSHPSRNLKLVVDVSCDPNNVHNPIPLYDDVTSMEVPLMDVEGIQGPSISMLSIDYLPALLPREASEYFSSLLLPSLLELPEAMRERQARSASLKETPSLENGVGAVWRRAENFFWQRVGDMRREQK